MPDEHRSAAAFDMMTFPLSGRRLIEASAGTGKTFSIAHLYLRLVLGVGAGAGQPLAVEQILVVTFTRAAASELRARIRTLLDSAYRDLRSGRSENAFIRALIEDDALDPDVLIRRLRDALLAMDEAAISTIHAFAVKAASTFVFETGAIDGVELSDTGDERGKRVLTDLYRRLCIDETGQGAIGELLGTPRLEEFRRYWGRHLPPDLACRPGVDGDPDQAFSALLARRQALQDEHEALAKAWRAMYPLEDPDTHVAGIRDRLVQDLEGNPTSALKPGQVNRLVEYFEALLFAPALGLVDRTGTVYFDTARKVLASTDSPASVRLMLRVRDHVQAIVDAREGLVREARAVVLKTLQAARADIDLKRMSLDEVISLVNRRLDRDDTRKPLRQAITGTWPVCLVDEFQDTDPEQFRMFNRIYGNDDSEVGTGLFMIGDPKQSIYAFRGADIFAYLNVRREVVGAADADQGLYTLDRNWRSKQALVSATNALFAEARPEDRTFVFDGIPFEPVVSSETTGDLALPTYRVGDDCPVSDHSLVFIGNPDDPADNDALRKDALIARYARDTARRIAALLDRNHGARVGDAPLRPGDIAVLVRSAREARAVRRALARPEVGLRSVYASQRDSVFADAEVAEDLLHVLVAMDQCTDKRRLRTALATPLMRGFDYDFAEVDRIDDDDEALERVIAEFGAYRDAWRAYGVLAALGRLFDDPRRNLLGRAAARPDSDRLLTDLRHLGDLLQQRDQDCDAPEQLIDWFAAQIDDDSAVDEDAKRIRLESDEDLVRVATIFVAKGLEYPVVFLPFFFLPGQVDLGRQLPMYRERSGAAWTPVVDFEGDASEIRAAMNRENLAEDMRLLYRRILGVCRHRR